MTRELPAWFEEDRFVPPPGSIEATRVWSFMQRHGIAAYDDLIERSLDPHWFYPAAIDDLGLHWPEPYHTLLDTSDGIPWTRWFVGGRTNLTHVCLDRWAAGELADEPALLWSGEDGRSEVVSFRDLADRVSRVAAGLAEQGIGVGDVVTVFLPMIPEAAVAILALCRLGAIAAPAFSGYGAEALAERLRIGEAKAVIGADGCLRSGKGVAMLPVVEAAVAAAPSVDTVIVVPRLGEAVSPPHVPWPALLESGESGPAPLFEPETPCLLAFTSGSSGRPKGAVHCHGRFLYRLPIEMAYNFDTRGGDRFLWVSDMGWIMGPGILFGALGVGAAFAMMEGGFDHPEPDRLWKLVDELGVTHLGLAPTIIRVLAGHGEKWVEPYDLETLRVLGSTGEPMTPQAWRWLHRHVGRGRRPIINITGGTEIGGAILTGNPVVPSPEATFAGPSVGMAVDVFDPDGEPVTGQVGELVVKAPWPSMTWGFWREPDRYIDTYWSRWEGIWVHGDRAVRRPDGAWELPGRSDDLIKVAGKRIGPTEYEAPATEVPGVLAAAAVGVPDELKGEVAALVILPTPECEDTPEELARKVDEHVTATVGKPMRPAAVLVVPDIPLTRSGKVHRRAVRGWLAGQDPGDLSNLDNPGSEAAILAAAEKLRTEEGR